MLIGLLVWYLLRTKKLLKSKNKKSIQKKKRKTIEIKLNSITEKPENPEEIPQDSNGEQKPDEFQFGDIQMTYSTEIFVNEARKKATLNEDEETASVQVKTFEESKINFQEPFEDQFTASKELTCESFVINQGIVDKDGTAIEDLDHMTSYTFRSPSVILNSKTKDIS